MDRIKYNAREIKKLKDEQFLICNSAVDQQIEIHETVEKHQNGT